MKKLLLALIMGLLFCPVNYGQSFQFKADDIDIAYKKYTLENGLTLLVHEDHKAPIAAVNVWYHVGSKNEKPGKSGFFRVFPGFSFLSI